MGRRAAGWILTALFVPLCAVLLYLVTITMFLMFITGRPLHFLCALGGAAAGIAGYAFAMSSLHAERPTLRRIVLAVACASAGAALLSRVPPELYGFN
jgi:hypothetical protein